MLNHNNTRPNVIIVMTDDQGYGDFSCLGNPVVKTPNVDRLHGECARLTDFHVSPMCAPTRGQLLSGRDALSNGAYNVYGGQSFIREGIPTMADIFLEDGYATGHFGKWHLGGNHPFRPQDRGFEETIHFRGSCITAASDYWQNDCFDDTYWHNGQLQRYDGYCTDIFFDEAKKWMKKCAMNNKPFFTYLALNAPHFPHFVPEKYKEPYKYGYYPVQGYDSDIAGFYGMIANMDENMGYLDQMLEENNLKNNTILIFMTDNGGTAGVKVYNAGMRGSKCSLYDGGHRVPCFVRWPDGKLLAGQDLTTLTHCQDILPTLVELCGVPLSENLDLDGSSLAPLLKGSGSLEDRQLVVQYSWAPIDRKPQKWDGTIMWNQWRLVKKNELYDMEQDPAQTSNVLLQYPEIAEVMKVHYEQWWEKVSQSIDKVNYISIGSEFEQVTYLSSHDWFETRCGHNNEILQGVEQKGPWNVRIHRDGIYQVLLSRWPIEAETCITEGMQPFKPVDSYIGDEENSGYDFYPEGKALPIGHARIEVQDYDDMCVVTSEDLTIEFKVVLKAGLTRLKASFYDEPKLKAWGAYYAYVQYIT